MSRLMTFWMMIFNGRDVTTYLIVRGGYMYKHHKYLQWCFKKVEKIVTVSCYRWE